jgi:hypothetical protein
MGQSGRERERRSRERGRAAATSAEERESGCDVGSDRRVERESGGRKKMIKTNGAWTWRLRVAQPENERTKEKGLNCEARLRKKKRKKKKRKEKKIESDGGGCCCRWIKKRKE